MTDLVVRDRTFTAVGIAVLKICLFHGEQTGCACDEMETRVRSDAEIEVWGEDD